MGSFNVLVCLCSLLVGQVLGLYLLPTAHLSPLGSKPTTLSSSDIKYFITGHKDSLGHWTEEVKLEHGDDDWRVEFDHVTLDVEKGNPKIQIMATLTALDKKENKQEYIQHQKPKQEAEEVESSQKEETKQDAENDVDFQIYPQSANDWFGARKECIEWGGDLAAPNTQEKLEKMTELLNKHNHKFGIDSAAFVGFNDIEQEGHFVTLYGKPVFSSDKTAWSPLWFNNLQPDDDKSWTREGEDCGSLRPNGGLNDVPCKYTLQFICEKPIGKDEATAPTEENSDDDDDDYDGDDDVNDNSNHEDGSLQLFPRSEKNWHEANAACQAWGGHLAVPDSEEKVAKMVKMMKSSEEEVNNHCVFVGFNDIQKEGEFVTIFGKPVFDPRVDWSPHWFNDNQPDDDKDWTLQGEDCGSIHPSGGLNDVPCLYNLPYFCEKTPGSAPTTTLLPQGQGEGESSNLSLFPNLEKNWFQAKEFCKQRGGRLAKPETSLKMADMLEMMAFQNVREAFLDYTEAVEDDPDFIQDFTDCHVITVHGITSVQCLIKKPYFCEGVKPASPTESVEENTSTSTIHTSTDYENKEVDNDVEIKAVDSTEKEVLSDWKQVDDPMEDYTESSEDWMPTFSFHSPSKKWNFSDEEEDDSDINETYFS